MPCFSQTVIIQGRELKLTGIHQSATAVAPSPAWWGTQTVTDPSAVPDDFAVANIGQLKYMAAKAAAMDAELPGGAGETIHLLVDPWAESPQEGVAQEGVGGR
jgi:hypothetical protein